MSQIQDTFLTITETSEGFYKEKGSKFIGLAFPVKSEEDIKSTIEGVRKKYHDARHHCYGWVLGKDKTLFRANDDGEPGHSAGTPILNQIRSKDLTDTLIIVVRYFGGTKLGVPGLIQAYKEAALDAIENNSIIEKIVEDQFILSFEYPIMNSVMKLVKNYNLNITSQTFEDKCKITLTARQSISEEVQSKFEKIEGLYVELVEI